MHGDIVMVPVPVDRLLDVYRLLGAPALAAAHDSATRGVLDESALLRRAYRESPPETMRAALDYLAERPGRSVSSSELAASIRRTTHQLAGVMGAFGRRWANRYGMAGQSWFFEWDPVSGYRMPELAAETIRSCRNDARLVLEEREG